MSVTLSTFSGRSSGNSRGDGVVVMGGGPAGMAAAYVLAGAAKPVKVLEKGGVLGGLSRTLVRDGFRFDIGGHRWFTKKEELNTFLCNLLGTELLDTPRSSRIYYDGKYFDYPISLGGILKGVKPTLTARAAVDYLVAQAIALAGDGARRQVNMREAYVAQFGRTLYELFFERYSRKVWGCDCDQLSGDWVVQRSRGLSLFTMVMSALTRTNGRVESLIDQFMYPRLGIGQISEFMGDYVEKQGGEVCLSSRVEEISHRDGVIEAVAYDHLGQIQEAHGTQFVSSIPITELVRKLHPRPPVEILEAAQKLIYRDLITVNVMLDQEKVTGDTWIYIHDPEIVFSRLHEPANWSPFMAPVGKTSLVAEYFCSVGDDLWSTSNDVLCEKTVDYLANNLRFISRRDVVGAFAVRCAQAYPTYLLGYDRILKGIKAYLASFRNLQIIGRAGTFRYNNMDHSVETGILAARNILGEAHDIDEVNSERAYHEVRLRT